MKKALFVLLTALPLAAFSAEGMSDDLKRFFSGLTAAERDNLGREAARSGKSVRDIVLERGLLDEITVDRLLSFENLTGNEKISEVAG